MFAHLTGRAVVFVKVRSPGISILPGGQQAKVEPTTPAGDRKRHESEDQADGVVPMARARYGGTARDRALAVDAIPSRTAGAGRVRVHGGYLRRAKGPDVYSVAAPFFVASCLAVEKKSRA